MRFKPGQKVVCTASGQWFKIVNIDQLNFLERLKLMFKGSKAVGPKFNDIVTVAHKEQNQGAIPLIEWRSEVYGQYQESCFEPLVKEGVMEAEIYEIFNPIEK